MNCAEQIISLLERNNINGHDKPGGTDKNTNHSYVDVYGEILSHFLGKNGSLLEIGVQYGGSSLLWHELLDKFKFCFIDINDQLSDNVKEKLNLRKYNFLIEDAYTDQTVKVCKNLHPGGFEIIIDDGPHTLQSQQKCIELYLNLLKVNGYMIIEDIQDFNSIEILKKSIPVDDLYDYEFVVHDLRERKQRYDDVIVTIKKKEKQFKNKIAVFYHLGQFGQWQRLFQEQMNSLVVSGLYEITDFIHIGINGNEPLPMILPKFKVVYNNNQILEADTLSCLHQHCKLNPHDKVMYFHSKGSTHDGKDYKFNVDGWRLYLEYFVIHRWKDCLGLLDRYDTVGTEFGYETGLVNQETSQTDWETNLHYQGNFWWANSSYISKLDTDYLYKTDKGWDRYRSEFWIGTKNPKKFNFYSTGIFSKYEKWDVLPTDYVGVDFNMNKKAKLVMITMFKNEAKTIKRMLESCYKYIDYYVIQDNGSTDGTPEIVEDFFKDKNIPGYVYKCEEGWVGFGWNRDHLLQKCQSTDHGCDWILKMDCDEILQVDDDFDWSEFDDKNLHAFHVTAIQGSTIYQRAWIWNAKFNWKFNHDTAHETIELLTDGIGADFRRHNLSKSFRQIGGFSDGESWQSPTKYISDALILEEKMIKENTFHSDLYHFWYIGKSYFDAIQTSTFPLKEKHSKEMARRCIFNFKEFLNLTHDFEKQPFAKRIDEMGYYATMLIGNCYQFLEEYDLAEFFYMKAEEFCPQRNEHLYNLALCYKKQNKSKPFLDTTSKMIDPSRKNPFPDFVFIVDSNCYYDTSNTVQILHEEALSLNNKLQFRINDKMNKRLWVVDDFYVEPDKVREFALGVEYDNDLQWYKGSRSKEQFNFPGIKEAFEKVMGIKLKPLESHAMCGRFQLLTAKDNLVYHVDSQKWAAMIYLTPHAPTQTGTVLLKSLITGARHSDDPSFENTFQGGFYDKTKFEVVDQIGNVYNRLIIMDARCIHAAAQYFGQSKEDCRLTHLFFFDNE